MAAYAQQQQPQLMQVQIPQGCVPGQMLQVQAPTGQMLQVAIPQGMRPGQVFNIQLPNAQPQVVQAQPPPGPDPMALFAAVDADRSGAISDIELSAALSTAGMTFSKKTCRYLIGMHDRDHSGTIDRNEFAALWNYLQQWKTCFDRYDKDHGGTIDSMELTTALKEFGYNTMGNRFYAAILRAYDEDKKGSVGMDQFIQLNCELHNLTASFKKLPKDATGRVTMTYEQFLQMTYSAR